MATRDLQPNGIHENPATARADDLLPGITILEKLPSTSNHANPPEAPIELPGPQVNGRPTTIHFLNPTQLALSPLRPSLRNLINDAFEVGHIDPSTRKYYVQGQRLRSDNQMLEELGNAPGTFTYIIFYTGTLDVVATASAKRYLGRVHVVAKDEDARGVGEKRAATWKRFGLVREGTAAWELSTMAVDPALMRQGLAGLMMRMAEEEVKRQFVRVVREAETGEERPTRLLMMLTTIREQNFGFYSRKGYALDYETHYEPGWYDSELGFTVVNMSKVVDLKDLDL